MERLAHIPIRWRPGAATLVLCTEVSDVANHRASGGVLRREGGGNMCGYPKVYERVLERGVCGGGDGAQEEEAATGVEFSGEVVEGTG